MSSNCANIRIISTNTLRHSNLIVLNNSFLAHTHTQNISSLFRDIITTCQNCVDLFGYVVVVVAIMISQHRKKEQIKPRRYITSYKRLTNRNKEMCRRAYDEITLCWNFDICLIGKSISDPIFHHTHFEFQTHTKFLHVCASD